MLNVHVHVTALLFKHVGSVMTRVLFRTAPVLVLFLGSVISKSKLLVHLITGGVHNIVVKIHVGV